MTSIYRFFRTTHRLLAGTLGALFAALTPLAADTFVNQTPFGFISRIDGLGSNDIMDTAIDGEGNVYVVGRGDPSEINFYNISGEGSSQATTTVSNRSLYVAKYDSEGKVEWIRTASSQIPGSGVNSGDVGATGVAVDGSGNVFVTGYIHGQTKFGSLQITPLGRNKAGSGVNPFVFPRKTTCVAMIDGDGVWQWVKEVDLAYYQTKRDSANTQYEVNSDFFIYLMPFRTKNFADASWDLQRFRLTNEGQCLTVDESGNIYLRLVVNRAYYGDFQNPTNPDNTGAEEGSITWMKLANGANGQVPLFSCENIGGGVIRNVSYIHNTVIVKLGATQPPPGSPAGTLPTYNWEWMVPITPNVTADSFGALTIRPFNSSAFFSPAVNGVNFLGSSTSEVSSMSVDKSGSLYLNGAWTGPNALGNAALPFGARDGFVARLRTSDGGPMYFARYSGDTVDDPTWSGGLVVDNDRNVYVSGTIFRTDSLRHVSADGTVGLPNNPAPHGSENSNVFIGKLNPAGQWQWVELPTVNSIVTTNYAFNTAALARDAAGGLYLGGTLKAQPYPFTVTASFGGNNLVSNQENIPITENEAGDAFVAKLAEAPNGSRAWKWVMQTKVDVVVNGRNGYFDTADIITGLGGTVYWSIYNQAGVDGVPSTTGNTEAFLSKDLTSLARPFSMNANAGGFLIPLRADKPTISGQTLHSPEFSVFTRVLAGREVPAPDGAFRDGTGNLLQPDITLPGQGNANGASSFYWDTFSKKLYAIAPVIADVKWKLTASTIDTARIIQAVVVTWPTPAEGLVTHVTGAGTNGDEPKVNLENDTVNYTFNNILYKENDASVSGNKQFSARTAGYSVLLYTQNKNTAAGSAPVSLEVVRTYLMSDPAVKASSTGIVGSKLNGAAFQHDDPTGRNGYLVNTRARYDGFGSAAAHNRETQMGPIIPVNQDEATTADDLVVIWNHKNSRNVSWPAVCVTYAVAWPPAAEKIVIASSLGSEVYGQEKFDPVKFQNLEVYHQPDKNQPGYNPNEEHALLAPGQLSSFPACFALRSNTNTFGGPATSPPFALVRYRDATAGYEPKFKVYQVEVSAPSMMIGMTSYPAYNVQSYTGTAGTAVQAPYPLPLLGFGSSTSGTGNAYFKDRKNQVWAKSEGTISARYFYQPQANFWIDVSPADGVADNVSEVPWLDNATPGTPAEVQYTITWPASVPTLYVGDTLTGARNGLPDVDQQLTTSVIYDAARAAGITLPSVRLFNYAEERTVPLAAAINGQSLVFGGRSYAVELGTAGTYNFADLPPQLKSRLSFNPAAQKLVLKGLKVTPAAGVPYILPNILTPADADVLQALDNAGGTAWDNAITALYNLSRNPNQVMNGGSVAVGYYVGLEGTVSNLWGATAAGNKALTAADPGALGYVTLLENDGLEPGDPAPVAMHILKVENPPVVGEIKIIYSENALDEKVTLRHSNDFAANAGHLEFEWWYQPAISPTSPAAPSNPAGEGWILLGSGSGMTEVTIAGPGLKTLADSWVFCRYRGYSVGGYNPLTFTDWAGDPSSTPGDRRAVLVEGWIKRVLEGINPFEARVKDFGSSPTQTYSSFITQAGTRYEGPVALNSSAQNLNTLGLIPLYETVFRRGLELSINGTPPQTNGATNSALLLAATRVSDFYMLLGNDAHADAQDPTIGFTSADGTMGSLAGSVFAFSNQTPNLITEELSLLRGRDNSSAGVGAAPVYNRLFWNFTSGLEGAPVYVQNYGISDQNLDGLINESDARMLFPMGHGDAWGHYLSALKSTYRLLRHPLFTWTPRSESTNVAGVAIEVDYLDERKFAVAAAALAATGSEILDLTYRDKYTADPAGQWQGYKDTDTQRAWGVDDWARRAGQGALLDWAAANAILPAVHAHPLGDPAGPPPSGLQKIDRTTVAELTRISSAFIKMQGQMDQVDFGLNPLGLTPGSILFDIDPTFFGIGSTTQGNTHFEQVYNRALDFLTSARRVFDHANQSTQRLRQIQQSASDFIEDTQEQEFDYKNRLIEVFGYPYAGDIGSGKTYPAGYDGPDIYHYNYININTVSGGAAVPDATRTGYFKTFGQEFNPPSGGSGGVDDLKQTFGHYFGEDGNLGNATANSILAVEFPYATASSWSFVAPAAWGARRAPGEIQLALSDMVRAEAELRRGLVGYNNHLALIQAQTDQLRARAGINAEQIMILNKGRADTTSINGAIGTARGVSIATGTAAEIVKDISEAVAEAPPSVVGTATDVFSMLRSGLKLVGVGAMAVLRGASGVSEIAAQAMELSKEDIALRTQIEIQKNEQDFEIQERLRALEALIREEVGLRLELFTLRESLAQSAAKYQILLAEGQRLMDERRIYRI
jgi:hypothetical protein